MGQVGQSSVISDYMTWPMHQPVNKTAVMRMHSA